MVTTRATSAAPEQHASGSAPSGKKAKATPKPTTEGNPPTQPVARSDGGGTGTESSRTVYLLDETRPVDEGEVNKAINEETGDGDEPRVPDESIFAAFGRAPDKTASSPHFVGAQPSNAATQPTTGSSAQAPPAPHHSALPFPAGVPISVSKHGVISYRGRTIPFRIPDPDGNGEQDVERGVISGAHYVLTNPGVFPFGDGLVKAFGDGRTKWDETLGVIVSEDRTRPAADFWMAAAWSQNYRRPRVVDDDDDSDDGSDDEPDVPIGRHRAASDATASVDARRPTGGQPDKGKGRSASTVGPSGTAADAAKAIDKFRRDLAASLSRGGTHGDDGEPGSRQQGRGPGARSTGVDFNHAVEEALAGGRKHQGPPRPQPSPRVEGDAVELLAGDVVESKQIGEDLSFEAIMAEVDASYTPIDHALPPTDATEQRTQAFKRGYYKNFGGVASRDGSNPADLSCQQFWLKLTDLGVSYSLFRLFLFNQHVPLEKIDLRNHSTSNRSQFKAGDLTITTEADADLDVGTEWEWGRRRTRRDEIITRLYPHRKGELAYFQRYLDKLRTLYGNCSGAYSAIVRLEDHILRKRDVTQAFSLYQIDAWRDEAQFFLSGLSAGSGSSGGKESGPQPVGANSGGGSSGGKRKRSNGNGNSNSDGGSQPAAKKRAKSTDVCKNYNNAGKMCSRGDKCLYVHKCTKCGGPGHPEFACKT